MEVVDRTKYQGPFGMDHLTCSWIFLVKSNIKTFENRPNVSMDVLDRTKYLVINELIKQKVALC